MPTYDYECSICGHGFESFQKITDKPLENCPKCGKRLRRLVGGGAGIIFKGSGFYATDYKKKPEAAQKPGCESCPAKKDGCQGKP